ncbi:Pr6Pr family membrane protein [soil metagenome]
MKILWRGGAAAIVWAGVLVQFWLMVHGRPPAEAAHAMVKFFSFFTVLSNIAVGAVLAAPVLAPDRALGRWAQRAGSRVAVGVYIAVTAGIYHTLLAGLWRPTGLQLAADILLHSVAPALFLVDFLAFPPSEAAKWGSTWKALVFPLVYGAWSLIHGAVTGFYPYPFLDVAKRGYGAVLVTMLLMGAGFYAVTLVLTGLQHLQRRLTRTARAPISA